MIGSDGRRSWMVKRPRTAKGTGQTNTWNEEKQWNRVGNIRPEWIEMDVVTADGLRTKLCDGLISAAYHLCRNGSSSTCFPQLSIINARCHGEARKSIRMDVFLTAAVISLSHVHRQWQATDTRLLGLKWEKFSFRKHFVKTNIVMMWNHETPKPPGEG